MSYLTRFQLLYERNFRRERVFRDRRNPLDIYSDSELYDRCRFTRDGLLFIVEMIGDSLSRPTRRNNALTPVEQIFIALRYFSSGTFYIINADTILVSKATVSRCVSRVSTALKQILHDVIRFPREDHELQTGREQFLKLGFPGIVGAIDCTHVQIQAPTANEFCYVNRKNVHSINVQAVCTADRKFINVVIKWPGSVHDARIWKESQLYKDMRDGRMSGILLGDCGYGLSSNLLTPFRNPNSNAQRRYNYYHKRCRVRIEQAFGILKRRFAVLRSGIRMEPSKCCTIIAACFALHNIAIDLTGVNSDDLIQNPENFVAEEADQFDRDDASGIALRNHFVNLHFS